MPAVRIGVELVLMIVSGVSDVVEPLLRGDAVTRRGDAVKSALNRQTLPRERVHIAVIDLSDQPTIADARPTRPSHTLQVLGSLKLARRDGTTIELPTRKSALLLACLAVPAGSPHPRDRLAELLWPSSGQEQARGSLRHALAALRKLLGVEAIENLRDRIALMPGIVCVDLDVVADVAEGRAAPSLPGPASTGVFLDGVTAEGETFDEWLTFERTRSRALQQAALQRIIDALTAADRHAEAIATAERLVALDPLREQSHRTLMRTFVLAGERSKALAQFLRLQDLLASELGAVPSPQSAALDDEIRRADHPGAAPGTGAPASISSIPPGAGSDRIAAGFTIAVLPFQLSSEDDRLADFAEAFSAELVTSLSRSHEFLGDRLAVECADVGQDAGSAAVGGRTRGCLRLDGHAPRG